MIGRLLIGILLLAVFGVALAYIDELDAAHSGPHGYTITVTPSGGGSSCPSGVLCPLTGGSLVSTNLGTVKFATSQGAFGYDVLQHCESSCTTAGLQAIAMTTVSGVLYFKYETDQPSAAPQTQCMKESAINPSSPYTLRNFFVVACPPGL